MVDGAYWCVFSTPKCLVYKSVQGGYDRGRAALDLCDTASHGRLLCSPQEERHSDTDPKGDSFSAASSILLLGSRTRTFFRVAGVTRLQVH